MNKLVFQSFLMLGVMAGCSGADGAADEPIHRDETVGSAAFADSSSPVEEWTGNNLPPEVKGILDSAVYLGGAYANIAAGAGAAQQLVQTFLDTLSHDPAPPDAFQKLDAKIDQAAGTIIFFDQMQALDSRTGRLKAAAEDAADSFTHGTPLPIDGPDDFGSHSAVVEAGQSTPFWRYFVESATDGATVNGVSQWKETIPDRPELLQAADGSHNLVYDWRLGVPSLVDAITFRLVVLAALHPNFKNDGYFQAQLMSMRSDLKRQYDLMFGGVRCGVSYFGDPSETAVDRQLQIYARTVCADIYSGMSEIKWNTILRADVTHDACITWVPDGNGGYTKKTDQVCIQQHDSNWYTFKSQMEYFKGDLASRVRYQLPLFQVQSMMDLLYFYAYPSSDLTANSRIRSAMPSGGQDMCATVSFGISSGSPVWLFQCTGSAAQQWHYNRQTGEIRNSWSNKCLDVTGVNPDDGTVVEIWDCNGGDNQRWTYDTENSTLMNGVGTRLVRPNNSLNPRTVLVGQQIFSPFMTYTGTWRN